MGKGLYCLGDLNGDLVIPFGELRRSAALVAEGKKGTAPAVTLQAGGSAANTSLALARLGQSPSIIGKIGLAGGGEEVLRQLEENGVDTSRVIRSPGGLLIIAVVLDETGERTMAPWLMPGGCDGDLSAGETDGIPADCDWIHTTGLALRRSGVYEEEVLRFTRRCREAGARVSLDLNLHAETFGFDGGRADVIRRMIQMSHVVFGSGSDELRPVTGTDDLYRAAQILSRGRIAVVRDGAGDVLLGQDGQVRAFPVCRVRQLHKIGAGDSFDAGFIAAMRQGLGAAEAVRRGCCCAAYTISHPSPMSVPDGTQLEAMLAAMN